MAEMDEVRLWAIDHGGGVGHVVAATGVWGRYVHTLCERLGNFETTAEQPKRICRACRERLAEAWPAKETAPGGAEVEIHTPDVRSRQHR